MKQSDGFVKRSCRFSKGAFQDWECGPYIKRTVTPRTSGQSTPDAAFLKVPESPTLSPDCSGDALSCLAKRFADLVRRDGSWRFSHFQEELSVMLGSFEVFGNKER